MIRGVRSVPGVAGGRVDDSVLSNESLYLVLELDSWCLLCTWSCCVICGVLSEHVVVSLFVASSLYLKLLED